MENGNGQVGVQGFITTPFGYQPIQPHDISIAVNDPSPVIADVTIAMPAKPKHDRSWMRTPEGRAKLSAAIKAGWAQKRLRDARVAARRAAQERTEENRTTEIDKAIAYHMNAIKTLQAAKALLK